MSNNTSTPGMEELEAVGADVHFLDYGFCFLCEAEGRKVASIKENRDNDCLLNNGKQS